MNIQFSNHQSFLYYIILYLIFISYYPNNEYNKRSLIDFSNNLPKEFIYLVLVQFQNQIISLYLVYRLIRLGNGRLLQLNLHRHDLIFIVIINDNKLEVEIRLLKSYPEFEIGITSKTIHQWLNKLSTIIAYVTFFKIFTHFVTMPVMSCFCGISLPKLSMVKIKLRSCVTQYRLESMMQQLLNST